MQQDNDPKKTSKSAFELFNNCVKTSEPKLISDIMWIDHCHQVWSSFVLRGNSFFFLHWATWVCLTTPAF